MKSYYVYILASARNGTLYIGVTNNLIRRIHEHATGDVKGFTQKYNVKQFVYYEVKNSIEAAIEREKELKHWNRAWKLELIEKQNPEWINRIEDFDDWIPGRAGNDKVVSMSGNDKNVGQA